MAQHQPGASKPFSLNPTGTHSRRHPAHFVSAIYSDYIAKPLVPDELVARIRVHLANSRLAHSARIALDISGTPLVAADIQGNVLWITPEASKLLGQALQGYQANDPQWRETAMPVLARIIARKLDNSIFHEGAGRAVFASFVGEAGSGEYLIRLHDSNSSSEDEILRKRFDLTVREAEVLRWIAQGKSNRDVASILACSPRTVNKHLEQIYHKLKVENRTAAAMLAVRVLSRQ